MKALCDELIEMRGFRGINLPRKVFIKEVAATTQIRCGYYMKFRLKFVVL
jgi:hypothetical protein